MMFEVYYSGYKHPIASFLYKSDAEMFLKSTAEKLPDLASRYKIISKREAEKSWFSNVLDKITSWY